MAIDMLIVGAGVGALAQSGTERYVALAILLTAMVGGLQILMGALRLGFIAGLLSRPVIAGLTTAASLIISCSQMGNLLGEDRFHLTPYHAVTSVLGRFDTEEDTDRLAAYLEKTEPDEKEPTPTAT